MSRNLPIDKIYKLDKKNRKSTSVDKSQKKMANIKLSYEKKCLSTKNSYSKNISLFEKLQSSNKKTSSRLQMKRSGLIP